MAQGQSTYTFLDTPLLAAGSFIQGCKDCEWERKKTPSPCYFLINDFNDVPGTKILLNS